MTTREPQPAPTGVVGRRSFLKRLGIGAGAVAVVAGGGLVWRSVDQSVLAPGTGPAFEPWHANLDGEPPLSLVNAAILAANAHDTQPWAFAVAPDRISLFADRSRSIGAVDPLGRELILSLGCALENLTLAAAAHGLEAVVSFFPDPDDPDHVAAIELVPGRVEVSPLFQAIPNRHTDRGAYDVAIPVERKLLDEMSRLADEPAVSLVWLTDDAAKSRFGQLTIDATAAIIGDPEQARDDFAWYRQDWGQIQRERDGITIDAGGLPELMRVLVRMLPPLSQASMQQAWVDATRDRHIATAAAYGLVLVRERRDSEQLLLAGRLLQRALLFATDKGLAVQPLNQLLERADREATVEVGNTFGAGKAELTPAGWEMVTAFRVGHSTGTPGIAPRRAVSDVVRT